MNYNQQQLETFLIEAELINQKVKALAENKISSQEIDKFTQQRQQDRKKRQEAQRRKEQEKFQQKLMGRDGKGITKDFCHFCRFCHKQYELETPTCRKCNRPTMTLQQRQAQLQHMVQDYKFNKKTREQKRQKWEMFQKTQAAVWKKSSINYNKKWQYFVQDSDQQPQKEPILPKNDPNFMALEADIEERKKKRAQDTQKAKRLKDKGNNSMKEGDYQKAMQYYTLALQHIKDIKSVYTNRALAFIKLKKFRKAIKDCTNVIEYMQIFEKVGESKDLTFKAYSRRALAKKEIKQYKQALEDIKQALKLFPEDKNGLILKKQIQGFIQHSETVQKLLRQNKQKQQQELNKEENKAESDSEGEQEKSKRIEKEIIKEIAENQLKQQKNSQDQKKKQAISKNVQTKQKQESPITAIPQKLKNLNEQNLQYLLNLIITKKQYKSIFISSKGIQLTLDHLTQNQSSKNQAFLISICLDGDGVGQKRVWDWGVFKIYEIIKSKFEDETKLNQSIYGFVDNLFIVLVPLTLSDIYRPTLASNPQTFEFLEYMFSKLITKFKKQPQLLDNFITFFSNLCSGESTLKNAFLKKEKLSVILDSLYLMVLDHKTKNRQILDLKQTTYSFIANVITNQQHRSFFVQFLTKNNKLADLKQEVQSYPRIAHNFQLYMQNFLSVMANATIDGQIEAGEISDAIFNRFIANWEKYNTTIVYRSLLILGRFKYTSNRQIHQWMKVFEKMTLNIDPLVKQEDKYIAQVVKILNVLFLIKEPELITHIPQALLKTLTKLVKQNSINQQLFCNTCNLFGIILDQRSVLTDKILLILRPTVGKLVQLAKERVGNWRKSAAILLGKCSFDPKCRQELNVHHGMEVLQSIASFVTPKK